MQIWNKARAGEVQAVGEILTRIAPRIERIAAHYARRTGQDSAELVQVGILTVLERLPGLSVDLDDPESHLVRAARWRMLDSLRWTRRRACLSLETEQPVIDRKLAEAGERIDLGAFIARLKPRQAQVVRGLMDGATWREVATQMGCSSANLAYHVRQIRTAYERAAAERQKCA